MPFSDPGFVLTHCLSDCTPYLLSLGLTKGQTSLVWVAGPLSGLIVQPIIGVLADESTSRWGRRRPIIAVGSVIVALGLLSLGFTKEIIASFVSDKQSATTATIVAAVMSLYATDFAINGGNYPRSRNDCFENDIADTIGSHVVLEESRCGYPSYTQTANRRFVE